MDMRSHVQKLFRFTRTAVLVSFRLWERQRERAGTLNLAKEYAESETYQIGIAIILATLMLLAATVAGAQPVADNLAKRKPEAVIDLATRSDVIVIATVEQSKSLGSAPPNTRVRVERWLAGAATEPTLAFSGGPRVAPGARYVFFLGRDGATLACLQPNGTVFPVHAGDDRAYADAIAAIRAARGADETVRAIALRNAMIAALSAPAPALRFHAVLELAALAHDGFPERERRALERILADPTTDPSLRPVLATILAGSG